MAAMAVIVPVSIVSRITKWNWRHQHSAAIDRKFLLTTSYNIVHMPHHLRFAAQKLKETVNA